MDTDVAHPIFDLDSDVNLLVIDPVLYSQSSEVGNRTPVASNVTRLR